MMAAGPVAEERGTLDEDVAREDLVKEDTASTISQTLGSLLTALPCLFTG